jgi:hypothetical protein
LQNFRVGDSAGDRIQNISGCAKNSKPAMIEAPDLSLALTFDSEGT